jgi:2'-5' RNA ligase
MSSIAAHLATLNEEVKYGEIAVKMLRSLPPHFKQITIKTIFDVLAMSVAKLTGRLKEAEEAFEEALMSLQLDRKL